MKKVSEEFNREEFLKNIAEWEEKMKELKKTKVSEESYRTVLEAELTERAEEQIKTYDDEKIDRVIDEYIEISRIDVNTNHIKEEFDREDFLNNAVEWGVNNYIWDGDSFGEHYSDYMTSEMGLEEHVKQEVNKMEESQIDFILEYTADDEIDYLCREQTKENERETKTSREIENTIDAMRENMGDVRSDDYRFDRIESSLEKSNSKNKEEELEGKWTIIEKANAKIERGDDQFEILNDTVNKIEAMDKEPKTRERDNSQSM